MNKKAGIAIALAIIIVIGAGVGFTLSRGFKPEVTTTVHDTSSTVTVSPTESTTVPPSETQTTESTTEDMAQYAFLQTGVWYLYDDADKSALAIVFTDEDDADIAYFDEANVMGEDAKYFKGDADYRIADGKVILEKLPEETGAETLVLDIDGEALKHGDTVLEKQEELSLEHPYNYFNS